MKRLYKDHRFGDAALLTIERAESVLQEFDDLGITMTARQLYYQFVTKNWIQNSPTSYKNLTSLIGAGRLAGLLDWDMMTDRTRQPDVPTEFESLDDLMKAALGSYRLPRWENQDSYVELWVEKDALASVLEPLASEFHVPLMVNRGYSSLSAMHEAAQRFIRMTDKGKAVVLLYLGDFDPSGEDMVRDIRDRLIRFEVPEEQLSVQKIGLTWQQVQQFRPPPNPVKMKDGKLSDSRGRAYVDLYGRMSWEVDALPPQELGRIVSVSIKAVRNEKLLALLLEREGHNRKHWEKTVGAALKRGKKNER